jgi:FKBP-type peptidyl-prolyl cis-trans isomerase
MRLGGRRRVIAPPERAFGDEGIEGLVPPRATLEFELELVDLAPAAGGGATATGGS